MSGVLNDCDALLQAASVRILNPDSAFINLTASAPGFHVTGAGAVDLATVTITADLIALDGDVVFTGQGVSLSNVKPRSVDATYVNGTGIVTATVVTNGETFARSYVIPVLRDGATGGSAKVLTLSPTEQVFKITKAGVNSPDSITLTASGQNLGGSTSFTIPIGTATLTAGANASQKILTFANMVTDSVTVQVAQDGQVDRVTIVKLREGLDGVSPVAGFLTNESVSIAATNAGAVGSLTAAGGVFRVLDGITDVTGNAAVTYSVAAETGVDVSIAANGTYTIASLSADTGTATLRAVYKGVTIDRVYTIVKARAGADGTAPVYVEVSTSGGQMFSRATAAAAFAPTSITLSAAVAGGTATAYQWQYWTGSAWTAILGATAASYAVASGSFTGSRVFRVAATVGGTTYLDEVTLVQVTGGTDGVDAITGVLSNELVALPSNSSGVVSSYTGAECTLRIYKGINEDGGWAFGFSPASSAAALAYTTSGGTATVTGLAAGVDAAFIDITATKAGHSSITKRFNVTKSRAGASVTGARGAGHYYVAGSSWSDVVAQAACPGGPVTNDVVTISSGTYVMEKRWTGSAWVENGVVINGKLIVPDSILASSIDTRGLSLRDEAGNIAIRMTGSQLGLQPGFEAPDTKNSEQKWGEVKERPDDISNLVKKSNADDGSVGGWIAQGWEPKSGANSAALPYRNALLTNIRDCAESDNAIPVTPGETIYFGVWLNTQATNYSGEFGAFIRGLDGSVKLYALPCKLPSGNAWTYLEGSIVIPAGSAVAQPWLFQNGTSFTSGNWLRAAGMWIGRHARGATIGAPSGTPVGGTEAGLVASRALQGESAYNALGGINSAIADKLSKSAASVLGAAITVSTSGGIVVGDLTFDAYTGLRNGGKGLAITPYGIVAHNGIKYVFAVSAVTGDAQFAGQLDAAFGSFGAVSIAAGGSLSIGSTGYGVGAGLWFGYHNGVPKFRAGDANQYIDWNGSELVIKKARVDDPVYAPFSVSAGGTWSASGRYGSVSFGSRTATVTGADNLESIFWTIDYDDRYGSFYLSSPNTQTVSLDYDGPAPGQSATLTVTAVGKDGRTVRSTVTVNATILSN